MNCDKSTELNKTICYTNESQFSQKMKNFINSYKSDKQSVAIISDFDLTITTKYDYLTKKEYKSSYYFFDEGVLGSKETYFYENVKKLTEEYVKYESDPSIDYNLRKLKTGEWYEKTLSLYKNPLFTYDCIDKMIQARKEFFKFRGKVKEFFETIFEKGIPLIIVSGGVTQFIEGALRTIFTDLDELLKEEKILIISNKLLFEGENKSCSGYDKNMIYQFNKAESISHFMEKKFPKLKNLLVFGDHTGDAQSVSEIKVGDENKIAFGFANINPDYVGNENKRNDINQYVNEFKKYYDMILVGNCDYSPIIEMFKNIN